MLLFAKWNLMAYIKIIQATSLEYSTTKDGIRSEKDSKYDQRFVGLAGMYYTLH